MSLDLDLPPAVVVALDRHQARHAASNARIADLHHAGDCGGPDLTAGGCPLCRDEDDAGAPVSARYDAVAAACAASPAAAALHAAIAADLGGAA